jgi:hypothetical protein
MKKEWFIRRDIFFIPCSPTGWALLSLVVLYAIYAFVEIDRTSHSISDTLMNLVFRMFFVSLAYSAIALFTCKKEISK